MIFLTFLTAIALSVVAGYYSVVGLASIFPGSFWPVVLMGAVLEASKLVTVSWLYRNWHRAGWALKVYLSAAVTILMLITSMGIFGYLSKAHLEHSSDTAPMESKIALLTEKIRIEKETIGESRKELKQLDEIVDQTVGRTTDEKGLIQAQALRRSQQKDRGRLVSQIEQSQKHIANYQEELSPLSVEFKKAEADLGPIKYVAALAYGDDVGSSAVEKAVRLVIGLIIIVFDPLAILLLIAGNISLANKHTVTEVKRSKIWDDFMKNQPKELVTEPESVGIVAQEVANVLPEIVATSDEREMVSVDYSAVMSTMAKALQEMNQKIEDGGVDKFAYLKQPFKHFENLQPMVAPKDDGTVNEVKMENIPEESVEIPKDNLIVIDEMGNSIPPITKYDYDEPFSFKTKPMDGGKF